MRLLSESFVCAVVSKGEIASLGPWVVNFFELERLLGQTSRKGVLLKVARTSFTKTRSRSRKLAKLGTGYGSSRTPGPSSPRCSRISSLKPRS